LQQELEKYYEKRFSLFTQPGWADLMEDAKTMFDVYNRIDTADSFEEFHKRKGQVDILQWLLSLKEVSERSWEDLQDEEIV
jgi:hypothetical protein